MMFKYVNNPNTPQGSVGCIISHFRCYKKLLASSHPYCLILEDDATLSADSLVVLRNLLQRKKKWNLIRLGYITWPPRVQFFFCKSSVPLNFLTCRRLAIDGGLINPRPYYFGVLAFDIIGTYAYLISREGAKLALNNWTATLQHLDVTMNLAPLSHQFAVMPSIFHHKDALAESATGWDRKYIPFRPRGVKLPPHIQNIPAATPPLSPRLSIYKRLRRKIGRMKQVSQLYHKLINTRDVLFVRKTA